MYWLEGDTSQEDEKISNKRDVTKESKIKGQLL